MAIWRVALHIAFLMLCVRFPVAAFRTGFPYPEGWVMLVLVTSGVGLGAWSPRSALFAFIVAVPLLNGLGYVGLESSLSPLSLVFAAMFVGISLRQIVTCKSLLAGDGSDRQAAGADLNNTNEQWDRLRAGSYIIADILITVVLASLVMQVVRHHDTAEFGTRFWSQPVFGYGDPLYFITSAFVWLQGLFFFWMLMAKSKEPRAWSEEDAGGEEQLVRGVSASVWVRPVLMVYGVTIAVFYILQRIFNTPETNQVVAPDIFFSPFEDIHSFGSFVVTLFIFAVASWRWNTLPRMIFRGLWIIGLLVLVVLSWSRATWLAGAISLLLVGWLRLPKCWTIVSLALLTFAIATINLNANRQSWRQNIYLSRLTSITRLENPKNKDPNRIHLYQKALGMIRDHPLMGCGIGSFYLTSVRYSRPDDPNAAVPDFAHNFLLQMAAELGVPVTALFLALILFTLWQGYRRSGTRKKFQVPSPFAKALADKSSNFQDHDLGNLEAESGKWKGYEGMREKGREGAGGGSTELRNFGTTVRRCHGTTEDGLTMLGVTLALTAYLITQMTANALNIYVSNQFFFWFLMAAIFQRTPENDGNALGTSAKAE